MTSEEFERYQELCRRNDPVIRVIGRIKDAVAAQKEEADSENIEYLRGYLCALSWVEGLLEEVENA